MADTGLRQAALDTMLVTAARMELLAEYHHHQAGQMLNGACESTRVVAGADLLQKAAVDIRIANELRAAYAHHSKPAETPHD